MQPLVLLAFPVALLPAVRVKRNSLHLPQWGCGQPAAAAAAPAAEGAGGGAEVGQQGQQQQPLPGDLPDLELLERVSAYPASKSWGRADTAPKASTQRASPAVSACVVLHDVLCFCLV
jgi:hypothetical protein